MVLWFDRILKNFKAWIISLILVSLKIEYLRLIYYTGFIFNHFLHFKPGFVFSTEGSNYTQTSV